MTCDHKEWVYPPQIQDDWSGEWVDQDPYQRYTQYDISLGAFKCSQCGEVGYYTGHWQKFHEEGVPCMDSENVKRELT